MKLLFRPEARKDLQAIGDWIARDSPARAVSFVAELEAKAASLVDLPVEYAVVARSSRGPVHKVAHGRYQLYYLMLPDRVEILQIRHSAQDALRFD